MPARFDSDDMTPLEAQSLADAITLALPHRGHSHAVDAEHKRVASDLAGLKYHPGLVHVCCAIPCPDNARYAEGLRRAARLNIKPVMWCPCYGTPEPDGPWFAPDDAHADTHALDYVTERDRIRHTRELLPTRTPRWVDTLPQQEP